MRRYAVVIAAAATGLAMVPASAAQARDLYMVKDVQVTNGVTIGQFAALSKTGKYVVGAVGAFSSEYTCIRGVVKNGKLRAAYYENGVPVGTFTRKWVGSGSSQRIKGMLPATYSDMVAYLEGGDPRAFITDCQSAT